MLMRILIVALIGWMGASVASGQKTPTPNVYEAWLNTAGDNHQHRGYLRELRDSSVVLAYRNDPQYIPHTFDIGDINTLSFRRKGRVEFGVVYGLVGGFASGIVLGYLFAEDDQSGTGSSGNPYFPDVTFFKGDPVLMTGLIMAPLGGLAGGLIEARKINIPIRRSQTEYQRQRERLRQYINRE